MERVAFLVEETGERIRCLLNPEGIEIRRRAGIHRRSPWQGPLKTEGLSDDPLLTTGGGSTEMRLHLLFDLAVEGADSPVSDVRELTRPLWNMTEGAPQEARFIWGKSWNVPGVVTAVAERLEQFNTDGMPRRSWLTLRFLRVAETNPQRSGSRKPPSPALLNRMGSGLRGGGAMRDMPGARRDMPGDGSGRAGERLDQVAQSQYGDPAYWRLVASSNGISEPLSVPAGVALRLPDAGNVT